MDGPGTFVSFTEVWIRKSGDSVVLLPKKASWAAMLAAHARFTSDFMREREQPLEAGERDPF